MLFSYLYIQFSIDASYFKGSALHKIFATFKNGIYSTVTNIQNKRAAFSILVMTYCFGFQWNININTYLLYKGSTLPEKKKRVV